MSSDLKRITMNEKLILNFITMYVENKHNMAKVRLKNIECRVLCLISSNELKPICIALIVTTASIRDIIKEPMVATAKA